MQSKLDQPTLSLLLQTIEILRKSKDQQLAAARLLIHSDVGPGNVIFDRGKAHALIDFTPEYEHELYARPGNAIIPQVHI